MGKPIAENRSLERRDRDEQIAAEPELAPSDLPADAVSLPVEDHLSQRRCRPVAVMGVVENGEVRPVNSGVKLPERSRVLIVTETQEISMLEKTADDNDVIYHYCPSDAFFKIIETQVLWLRDLFSTNDKEEHRWLRKIATDVIKEECERPSGEYDDATMKLLQNTPIDCTETGDIYLACFSKLRDSIGQWRAYADDGHGVAIGFSRKYLNAKQEQMDKVVLEVFDVKYELGEQEKLVRDAIGKGLDAYRRAVRALPESESRTCQSVWRNRFYGRLWEFAPGCKHRSFREEQEVRVVDFPSCDEDHELICGRRSSRSAVAKYYELPISPTEIQPIKEIMLGPQNTSHPSDVEEFVADHGYKIPHDDFTTSDVPYRSQHG
ncbi:MAG: DUF2971 domain-containing protein [Thermoguttaceae bacterium]